MSDIGEIRARLDDPRVVVALLGLDKGARRQRGSATILCPAHDEKSPSCSVSRGRDGTVRCRCFSCGWTGDVLHLVAAAERLDIRHDFPKVLERAAELAGVPLDEPRAARPKRRPRPVGQDLALRIDAAAEDWLAGRTVRPDPVLEGKSWREIRDAFELLADADEIERLEIERNDLEMERLADEDEGRSW